MLNKIIHFSLANRLIIIVFATLLLIFGTFIATKMEVDVFPDLTAPTVVILTEAHGLAPEEVEKLVTFPIETSVNGAANVRRVRSSSSAGFSIVWVEFEWNTDIFQARQIVNEKINAVGEMLPKGIGTPTMAPQSSIMGEIMLISLTADSTSQMSLRTLADWNIRPRLMSVGGVAQVMVIGGDYKQYQILASPQKMKAYNVTLNELLKASEEANGNSTGGIINQYGNEYNIKGIGRTNDILEKLTHDLHASSKEVRTISHQLMPLALKELGIVAAMQDMLEKVLTPANIKYDFEEIGMKERLPEKIEVSLYRIAQELTNNIIKHSGANQVTLTLNNRGGFITMIVEDNGHGFKTDTKSDGIGLTNISSRINLVHGELKYESNEETGTVTIVRIPLSEG